MKFKPAMQKSDVTWLLLLFAFIVVTIGLVIKGADSLTILAFACIFFAATIGVYVRKGSFELNVTDTAVELIPVVKTVKPQLLEMTEVESAYILAKVQGQTPASGINLVLVIKDIAGNRIEVPYEVHGKNFHGILKELKSKKETLLCDTLVEQSKEGFDRILAEVLQGKIQPQPYLEHDYVHTT